MWPDLSTLSWGARWGRQADTCYVRCPTAESVDHCVQQIQVGHVLLKATFVTCQSVAGHVKHGHVLSCLRRIEMCSCSTCLCSVKIGVKQCLSCRGRSLRFRLFGWRASSCRLSWLRLQGQQTPTHWTLGSQLAHVRSRSQTWFMQFFTVSFSSTQIRINGKIMKHIRLRFLFAKVYTDNHRHVTHTLHK